jgi:hypothetical protein
MSERAYPPTKANRALLRAALKRDEDGMRQALSHGACPDTIQGEHNSVLLLCVLGSDNGFPQGVRMLLEAGAMAVDIPCERGRAPIEQAARIGRGECFLDIWNHVGGIHGLKTHYQTWHKGLTGGLLEGLIHGAKADGRLLDVLRDVANFAQDKPYLWPLRRSQNPEAQAWPWIYLASCENPCPKVMGVLEELFPFPNPSQKGAWLSMLAAGEHSNNADLRDRLLAQTPPAWLLDPYFQNEAHKLIEHLPANHYSWAAPISLMERYAYRGNRSGSRALIRKIQQDPLCTQIFAGKATSLLDWAAYRGSMTMVRDIFKACPQAKNVSNCERMALRVFSAQDDAHRRIGMLRSLLGMNADPNSMGKYGYGLLHAAAKWGVKKSCAAALELLDSVGADWQQVDHGGKTALDILRAKHPGLGELWRSRLEQRKLEQNTGITVSRHTTLRL